MMSRLDEAVFNVRETAVEEWVKEHGHKYDSALEGFGDMTRKLETLQECLVAMEGQAASVVYAEAKMYAAVRIMMGTVTHTTGGDLLDRLEEFGDA